MLRYLYRKKVIVDGGDFLDQAEKDFRHLTMGNQFIFSKVMRDKGNCKEILSRLLPHLEIHDIKLVEYEKVMDMRLFAKAVRLDIYLNDGTTVYNVEMQTSNKDDLAKRSRFYQAHIDMDCLAKGEEYQQLKDCFVIFLCRFDVFRKNLPIYTFTNQCHENSDIELKDGATKIFFNTENHEMVSDPKMAEFLRFLNCKSNAIFQTEDEFIQRLQGEVETIKQKRSSKEEYMVYEATLQQERYYARKEGMKEGMEEGIRRGEQKGKIDLAMEMIKENESIEKIMKYTKLSESQIKELQNQS